MRQGSPCRLMKRVPWPISHLVGTAGRTLQTGRKTDLPDRPAVWRHLKNELKKMFALWAPTLEYCGRDNDQTQTHSLLGQLHPSPPPPPLTLAGIIAAASWLAPCPRSDSFLTFPSANLSPPSHPSMASCHLKIKSKFLMVLMTFLTLPLDLYSPSLP